MPRDANGNTNPLPGTIVATGDTILPSQHNPMVNDVYAMMTQSLSRDGQGGMSAVLNMNSFPIRNLGAATQPNDAVPLSQFQSGTPVGSVVDFAGVTPPNTWMMCFGQTIEVSAYPDFVAAAYVGNALNATAGFGYRTTSQTDPSANRSTSGQYIVLPDLRGTVSAGKDDMGGVNANRLGFISSNSTLIGGYLGSAGITLTIDQIPSHNHGGGTGLAGSHNHTPAQGGQFTTNNAPTQTQATGNGPNSASTSNVTSTAPDHNHTINSQGGGLAHPNAQPTLIMNKIIKVSY